MSPTSLSTFLIYRIHNKNLAERYYDMVWQVSASLWHLVTYGDIYAMYMYILIIIIGDIIQTLTSQTERLLIQIIIAILPQ